MLPHDVACCTLLVARCTLQLRLQRNAICVALFNFLVRAMATAKETQDTGQWAMGTVSVGGHVWPSVACNYPNANLVLIRVDTLHWERASCNQCQNDCGLTGENLWFDPCIFCHLSSRVGLESSWSRAA